MLATRIEGWDVQIFDRLFLMGGRTAFVKRPCSPSIRKPRFIVCTARYYPRICNHCIPCDTPIYNVRTARSSPIWNDNPPIRNSRIGGNRWLANGRSRRVSGRGGVDCSQESGETE